MTFGLIPGAGGSAWFWSKVESELSRRGHEVVAVDRPADDETVDVSGYRGQGDRRSRLLGTQAGSHHLGHPSRCPEIAINTQPAATSTDPPEDAGRCRPYH